ncbi:hypothetical protein THAOC_15380 [Thalassiosira oceanica]|uniref:HAT C-terminal dimerisation domain-containing protein n=1 Tax=Thalassiosira oceanica TaxID=159749 RepID=K0SCR5_THAOC|nr:hypothetical protein THAOC_15380 [Thalassiosira oceanica]|eukprot:EJK63933.1 hypothetical protein THAOC_15380 [Thalassiosira oceanica]
MPPKRRGGSGAAASEKKKAKKKTQATLFQTGSKAEEIESLNKLHRGKRVLLYAKDLYNNAIPPGEENYLFQYAVKKVYAGEKGNLASLDFENNAIVDGGNEWINYRYNVHLAKVNRKKNDLLDAEREAKKAARENDQNDTQAIFTQFSEDTSSAKPKQKCSKYLRANLRATVRWKTMSLEVLDRMLAKLPRNKCGSTSGQVTGFVFKKIRSKGLAGSKRLDVIEQIQSGYSRGGVGREQKSSRDDDMVHRVLAVLAAVGSKSPLSIFDNTHFLNYLAKIAPQHTPPNKLERTRLVEVILDGAMMELSRIISERRAELYDSFMSGTIDFWTDSHRKEQFGAFVIDVTAERYELSDGTSLFMSRETKQSLLEREFILNFEKFDKAKTTDVVADWMDESSREVGIKPSDYSNLSADGGSNAIGSLAEYEVVTRCDSRANELDFNICYAHQCERSAVNALRWCGVVDEAERSNTIMGDLSDTLQQLYAKDGIDYGALTTEEKSSGNIDRVIYTDEDKSILLQFEAASAPVRLFSKFLQDRRDSVCYLLYESRLVIQHTSTETFSMHADISHRKTTRDLRKRGEKSILVRSSKAFVGDDEEKEYVSTIDMEKPVEDYRELFSADINRRLCLSERRLPDALVIPTLLNPMFVELDTDSEPDSEDDDDTGEQVNSNYNRAVEELQNFETYKKKKFRPKLSKEIQSKVNLADYVNELGRFRLLPFFHAHKQIFPTLWVIAQRCDSYRVVEVGCERFFNLSGYISSPQRTRLGVRNYERLAMLASLVRNVYINEEWVAQEYLRRCKAGAWKPENTAEALKCWNLEQIIEAKLLHCLNQTKSP